MVFYLAAHGDVLFHAAPGRIRAVAGEAVGEDLIHDAAAEPGRGLKAALVYREAEAVPPRAHQLAEAAAIGRAEPELTAPEREPEAVPERGGRLRHGNGDGPVAAFGDHVPALLEAVVPAEHQLGALDCGAAVGEGKAQRREGRYGADGGVETFPGGVVGDVRCKFGDYHSSENLAGSSV